MFKAKDIVTKVVITTVPDMPIYDGVRLLVNRNVSGLPVVDEELNLVGLLSEKDVLRILYEAEDSIEKTVGDFMSTEVISFDENANLIELCDCLITNNIRRVPVTKDGKLLGVVSRGDVIRAILRIKHQEIRD